MGEFFTKAFSFKGETSRKNYWLTTIFIAIINSLIISSLVFLNIYLVSNYMELNTIGKTVVYSFSFLFELYIGIASLSMSIRRLHSIGKSGAWWFINFIPVIGSIIFFVLMLMPNKVINNSTADETLTKEIQRINGYNLEQENRVENALGHKLSIKEQVVSYTTETDLNSFVFLLEGETTSSYVQKRLKKALAIFGSLFAVIILINVINLIFSLNLI